jgi:hypothetical protein
MSALGFIIIFIIIILCIGILRNIELSRDEKNLRQRRRQYSRFRSVFDQDKDKFSGYDEKKRDDRENNNS